MVPPPADASAVHLMEADSFAAFIEEHDLDDARKSAGALPLSVSPVNTFLHSLRGCPTVLLLRRPT